MIHKIKIDTDEKLLEKKMFEKIKSESITNLSDDKNCIKVKDSENLTDKAISVISTEKTNNQNIGYADAYTIFESILKTNEYHIFNSINFIPETIIKWLYDMCPYTFGNSIDEPPYDENQLCKYAGCLFTLINNYNFNSEDIKNNTEIKSKIINNIMEDIKNEKIKNLINNFKNKPEQKYEMVNHPTHYNNYDKEVIEMMIDIWGKDETAIFCKLNAFKYRMRMGTKPDNDIEQDINKEKWYLEKFNQLKNS